MNSKLETVGTGNNGIGRNVLLFVCWACCAAGCAPGIVLRFTVPGPINLGTTQAITVVQTEGRRSAVEEVVAEFTSQVRSTGFYQVKDRSEEGIKIEVAGQNATVSNDSSGGGKDELYLRLDVLEWNYGQNSDTQTTKAQDGTSKTTTIVTSRGRAVLAVTICKPAGGPTIIAEKEFVGEFITDQQGISEGTVMSKAGLDAIAQLVQSISPQLLSEKVRLDDSDPALEGILALIKDGNHAIARQKLDEYVAQNPNSGPGWYNLALVTDAMGEYQTAMSYYDKAIQVDAKDFYYAARSGCATRLSQAEALATQP